MSYEDDQDCAAEDGTALNDRCTTGFCRGSDNKCGCDDVNDCSSSEVCHTDNKCYSSGLSFEQDCSADNGDALNSRCASGICRNSDETCRCTSNSHCPSNKVCKTSTNECVTQQYRFSADCQLGKNGEETTSQVSLNVKRDGWTVVDGWIPHMDKPGGCPSHTFTLAGGEPDEFIFKNHGNDKLGVDYFTLWDVTNPREIRRWGADGDGVGWCFSSDSLDGCWAEVSGANFPNIGVTLYKSGSEERIRFGSLKRCDLRWTCSSLDCATSNGCGLKKCCA